MMTAPSKDITEFHEKFAKLVDNVSQVVVGKEAPIRQCATAMVVGGHILLEDNPGTGKTQLARGLANSIDMSFKRIQFTPDLLPSDVVGVTYYDQKRGEFEYREGPIFASIVLADEINRASPKHSPHYSKSWKSRRSPSTASPTRCRSRSWSSPPRTRSNSSAPTSCRKRRWTVSSSKTTIGYPSHDVSVNILKQVNVTDRAATVHPVLTGEDVLRMRNISETVHLDDAILEYIVRLVEATRHNERIQVGSSMRGALRLDPLRARMGRLRQPRLRSARRRQKPRRTRARAPHHPHRRSHLRRKHPRTDDRPDPRRRAGPDLGRQRLKHNPAPGIRTTQSERSRNAAFAHSAAQTDHPTIPTPPQTSHQATGHLIRVAAWLGGGGARRRLAGGVRPAGVA